MKDLNWNKLMGLELSWGTFKLYIYISLSQPRQKIFCPKLWCKSSNYKEGPYPFFSKKKNKNLNLHGQIQPQGSQTWPVMTGFGHMAINLVMRPYVVARWDLVATIQVWVSWTELETCIYIHMGVDTLNHVVEDILWAYLHLGHSIIKIIKMV